MLTLLINEATPMQLVYRSLQVCGALSLEHRLWSKVYTVFQLTMMLWLTVCAGIEFLYGSDKLADKMLAIQHITVMFHLIAKQINCILRETEIKEIISKMEYLRNALKGTKGGHFTWSDALVRKFFIFSALSYGILMLLSPLFNSLLYWFQFTKQPSLLLHIWVPMEYRYGLRNYLTTSAYLALIALPTLFCLHAYAILLIIFTLQLSALIRILQDRFIEQTEFDKDLYELHVEVIRTFNKFNKLFSGQLYFEIVLATFQPCGFGYGLIKSLKANDPTVFDFALKFTMAATLPLIICGCGEELSMQFEKLHHNAYMSNWHRISYNSRRHLTLLMVETCRPHHLRYKGVVVFNMACYASVLQGTYSYLTMLINLDI